MEGNTRNKLQENIARLKHVHKVCQKILEILSLKTFAREAVLKSSLAYVVRGNAVQICSDFPAKRLSIFLIFLAPF